MSGEREQEIRKGPFERPLPPPSHEEHEGTPSVEESKAGIAKSLEHLTQAGNKLEKIEERLLRSLEGLG